MSIAKITDLERHAGRLAGFTDEQIIKARAMPGISQHAFAPDGDPAAGERSTEQRSLQREADRLSDLIREQNSEIDRLDADLAGVRARATSIAPQIETIRVLEEQIRECKRERARLEVALAAIEDQLATPAEKAVARAGKLPLSQVLRARGLVTARAESTTAKLPNKPAEKLDFAESPDATEMEIMEKLGWDFARLQQEREKNEMEHLEWADPRRDMRAPARVTARRPGARVTAEAHAAGVAAGLVPGRGGGLDFDPRFIAELRALGI